MKKLLLSISLICLYTNFYSQVSTLGNSYSSSSFIGSNTSSIYKPIDFKINGQSRMFLSQNGSLGINTLNPNVNSGLHLHQKMLFLTGNTTYGGPNIIFGDSESSNGVWGMEYNSFISGKEGMNFWRVGGGNYFLFLHNSGKVGINTNNPTAQLSVNGNVMIGNPETMTLPSGYKLYVETGILTEKVKVALRNTSDWADYVFEPNYELKPLNEVKKYVELNKHLPGVPSASELVEKQGYDIAEMDAKLLEKIEELTLYMISLSEENKLLKEKLELMQSQKP